ncbi:hypothetical protein EVAR_60357_1 [Eumeta japonica]|uniref:Uncharacterized protein n=1 Tax=Eumeta variegata TaxID=151549 RepID=A0A4C1Z6C4_EUMVA|nr:hypothetical protein EVAR_60357_1 [Eumeta japonica]
MGQETPKKLNIGFHCLPKGCWQPYRTRTIEVEMLSGRDSPTGVPLDCKNARQYPAGGMVSCVLHYSHVSRVSCRRRRTLVGCLFAVARDVICVYELQKQQERGALRHFRSDG